jgi:3-oxoacyl-[acyl-carrier protein] reductase
LTCGTRGFAAPAGMAVAIDRPTARAIAAISRYFTHHDNRDQNVRSQVLPRCQQQVRQDRYRIYRTYRSVVKLLLTDGPDQAPPLVMKLEETPVTERVAIVTGAARGIGAATARRLASDGMAVAVLDLDEAACAGTVKEITDAGGRAVAVGADVSKTEHVQKAVERVAEELGGPTVLVNNAGVIRDNLLFKMTDEDWDTVLGVHLRGAFLMSRAVQKHMVDQHYGRIVNLSSSSALGNRGQVNYSAAKAGMQGFTKTLAIELGPYGVTANAVAPGFIVTDMTAATAARIKMPFEDFQTAAAGQIPVRRVGQPEDVAHTISFLVSDGAGFVSGQVIYVAGGPLC